jgi:hypothetical protein
MERVMSKKPANPGKPNARLLLLLLLMFNIIDVIGGCGQRKREMPKPLISPFPNEYTVLIKKCKSEEEACAVSEQLRAARINNSRMPSGDIWLVYVGKYLSEKRAQRSAEDLKNRGWNEAIVLSPGEKAPTPDSKQDQEPPPPPQPWPIIFVVLLMLIMAVLGMIGSYKSK